jgi:endonuclease/exonuclease/phosphatase family metal-dependent hydrolase
VKKILSRFTDLINFTAITGLLLAYASPYVNPQDFWPIAFFGLNFQLLGIFNVLLIIIWIKRKKKRVFYNLLVFIIGLPYFNRNFQFNNEPLGGEKFSIVSFNTHVQSVYNGGNTTQDIQDYLIDKDVELAVLLEWLDGKGSISKDAFPHQQFVALNTKRNKHRYGLNFVSKYPIAHWEQIRYSNFSNNLAAFFDVALEDQTVRVIAVHLQSNGVKSSDYQEFITGIDNKKVQQKAKRLIGRLKDSFQKRASQVKIIEEVIEESPYPVLVVGDFNDTPQSYAYETLRGQRKDAFVEQGSGMGSTYRKPIELLRIDYILYDEQLRCTDFIETAAIESDHKLLQASFTY